MIKPTIGRVVWYHPGPGTGMSRDKEQACASQIVFVHSDEVVNLAIWDHFGTHHARVNVPLVQDGDPVSEGEYCEWMPYQKGQAAKEESPVDAA